jgi:hypothetical protein
MNLCDESGSVNRKPPSKAERKSNKRLQQALTVKNDPLICFSLQALYSFGSATRGSLVRGTKNLSSTLHEGMPGEGAGTAQPLAPPSHPFLLGNAAPCLFITTYRMK